MCILRCDHNTSTSANIYFVVSREKNILFTPSLGRVRRPCRGLEKFFPPVLQRYYGCSFDAQEIVHTGHGTLCFCFFFFFFWRERWLPKIRNALYNVGNVGNALYNVAIMSVQVKHQWWRLHSSSFDISFIVLFQGCNVRHRMTKLSGYTGRFIRPMNQPTHINICSFNARSLRNKMTELSQFINLHKIHILAVCESWLSDLDTDLSVSLPGLSPVSKRPEDKRWGCMCIHIQPNLWYAPPRSKSPWFGTSLGGDKT